MPLLLQIVVAPGEEANLNEAEVNSIKVTLTPTDSNSPMTVDQLEVKVCKGRSRATYLIVQDNFESFQYISDVLI